MNEEWRAVVGYEGYYEVSSHGRVRSLTRQVQVRSGYSRSMQGRLLNLGHHLWGYSQVSLSVEGVRVKRPVHRLVALAFLGQPEPGQEVCHGDGSVTNNHVNNLRWGSKSENAQDKRTHGNEYQFNKTHCKRHHPLEAPNLVSTPWARERNARNCLACARAHSWVYKHPELRPQLKPISDSYYADIMKAAA